MATDVIVPPDTRRRGCCREVVAQVAQRCARLHTAVDLARDHGAQAVEGYPTTRNVVSDELHFGSEGTFAAGLIEVSRPSPRRVVMRPDF